MLVERIFWRGGDFAWILFEILFCATNLLHGDNVDDVHIDDDEMEAPPIDAPIVEQPEPVDLLDNNGVARDMEEYIQRKEWNLEDVLRKELVFDGVWRYIYLVRFSDSWHSRRMIAALKRIGWNPTQVDEDSRRRNSTGRWWEFRCSWEDGHVTFGQMSDHMQRLAERDFG